MRRLLLGALLLALAMSGSVAYAQSCPAINTQLPADNATGVSLTPTLKWSAVAGATEYDVYLGSDCNGQPIATVQGAANTTFTPPKLNPATTYRWKVAAKGSGLTCPSNCATFTTYSCPAAPPALIEPTRGTVEAGNVTLRWNAVADATSYEVFVSLNGGNFVSTIQTQTEKSLLFGRGANVAWYVTARRAGCPDQVSEVATFSTSCPSGIASLISPSHAVTLPEGQAVTFDWTAVADATSYTLLVTNDGFVTATPLVTTTNTEHTAALAKGEWDWTVRANFDGNCPPTFAQPDHFFVGCTVGTPQLVAPGDHTTHALPITFAWSRVEGASRYVVHSIDDQRVSRTLGTTSANSLVVTDLGVGTHEWWVNVIVDGCGEVSSAHRRVTISGDANCPTAKPEPITPANNASNVPNPVRFEWRGVDGAEKYRLLVSTDGGTPFAAATTDRTEATVTVRGTAITWGVEALFADNCPATFSNNFRFTALDDECPANPGKATLVSPANGATNLSSPVTFDWNPVADATAYRVIFGLFTGGSPQILGTTADTQLTADVPAGAGYWMVQALFGDHCATTLSDRFSITIANGATCDNAGPALLSPANNSTVGTLVNFQWNRVPDAISYVLYVAAGADLEVYGETRETSLEKRVPVGAVRWMVGAKFAACPEARSSVFSFIAKEERSCPTGAIALTSPAEGATVQSPVRLAWTAVAGVDFYRVWVGLGRETEQVVARTSGTETTLELPAGAATWYIEGLNDDGCEAILSPKGHFTVQAAASCDANALATLISPVGTREQPANATSPVEFKWNAATNAIAYRLWISHDNKAFEDIAFTRETSVTRELPAGFYAWYLELFYQGCPSRETAPAYFVINESGQRCGTAQPTPISPAEGATATSPVTFLWSAVDDAEKYRVYASLDGGEPIFLGVTTGTELTRVLPPGIIDWRVEAVFRECPSTFSPRTRFTVEQAQNCPTDKASLVSPANNATVDAPATFVWNAVSGAVRYVLIARLGDGSPTPIAETTDTTITRNVPRGELEWWVLTFFRGCDPTESEHFLVNVEALPLCPTRKPVLLQPRDSDDITSPVHFAWSAVPNAIGYQVWVYEREEEAEVVAATSDNEAEVDLPPGTYGWFVTARFANCPSTESARAEFTVGAPVPCGTPAAPGIQAVGQALSNTTYGVLWTPVPNATRYELQESTSLEFEPAETFVVNGLRKRFKHDVAALTQYLYRVRAISDCNDERGPYSDAVGVFVVSPQRNASSAELGAAEAIVQKIFLPGSPTPLKFTATADKPWLTISPASGTLPAEGITLVVTADPNVLLLGTNTGTVSVQYTAASTGSIVAHATTVSSIPVSISLVTPVTPVGKGTPPPDALVFGAVGHGAGLNGSQFESDVRITNLSAQTQKYQVNYTPSRTDGTVTGSSTTIEIPPNGTTALDDIVSSVYGLGQTGSALGMLEVRPLTTSTSSGGFFSTVTSAAQQQLLTLGSSRTYNHTPNGTFGQFIPATLFSKFAGVGKVLSLQQVAQSAQYRGNFGFLEASGQPAELVARVFNTSGDLLATIPISLQASEHQQHDRMLANNGIGDLADGRVEVEVVGGNGKVTAYVSEIDNATNDPLLVSAVDKGAVNANRYIVPGMAHKDLGFAFWVSDLRIFNASSTGSVDATLTFYKEAEPSVSTSKTVTFEAGKIAVLNDVVQSLFAQPNGTGGSIVITTKQNVPLEVTARTYNRQTTGTFGQFIPGVTVAESVGLGARALQILQVEHSSRLRTNIGLNETTGNPATVEIGLIQPDSIATPFITWELQPNEYRQISVGDFGLGDAIYNARVTVKVISGTGKVTAYGSSIDMITGDPTYVPSQ